MTRLPYYAQGMDALRSNTGLQESFRRWAGTGWIPAVLALLTVLFMMPFIDAPAPKAALDGSDLRNQVYPLTSLIFDHVRDGMGVPLWNPYQFAGQSIATNPQSSLFYPFAWGMVLLGVPRGVGWLLGFHLWWGGCGFALFARRIGASSAGALAGGIVYEFSALAAAHVGAGHFNYMLAYAWLPWIAAAYWWSRERPNWLLAGLPGAVAFSMSILAGYPPLIYLSLLWLLGLWLCGVAAAPGHYTAAAVRTLRPLLIIGIGGVLLSAVLLLPVTEFALLRSSRAQDANLTFSNSFPMPAGQILTLVIPNLFGHPRLADHGYWGLPFYEELTAYLGIVPLVAIFRTRPRPISILLVLMVVLGIVISLGVDGGLFTLLYHLLPGYNLFRVPPRMLLFTVVGGAGLTALFITDLQALDHEGRVELLRPVVHWVLPAAAILAAALAFLLLAYYTAHSTDDAPPWRLLYSAHMTALAVVAMGAAWFGLRLWTNHDRLGREPWLVVLTLFIIVIDLWHISPPMITASTVDVPEMWKLMAQTAPARPDFRVMTVPDEVIWQAGSTYTHHLNVSGYDPLISDQAQDLLDASGHNPTTPIARLLGVRYVITNKPYDWLGLSGFETLTEITQEQDWHIYETANPLPHAFIAPAAQVIADNDMALRKLASGEIDPGQSVVVDRAVNCVSATPGDMASGAKAQIVRYTPDVVEIATHSEQPGVLVLTDIYDPYWKVTVDGQPADLLRVDTALRGVCVAAGAHQVRFEYRPVLLFVGLLISAVSWVFVAIVGLIILIRLARVLVNGRGRVFSARSVTNPTPYK
jgi:hypothetical protein